MTFSAVPVLPPTKKPAIAAAEAEPLVGVEAHEIAHRLAGLGLDDPDAGLARLLLVALEEGRLDQDAAVDERADRHQRLQRRDRDAVAEGDGDGVELAPARRHDRPRVLRQFGTQAVELAHLAQEGLVALDADAERHARGADVRGVDEHLRHRQDAVLARDSRRS